jgi:hypothetical protein
MCLFQGLKIKSFECVNIRREISLFMVKCTKCDEDVLHAFADMHELHTVEDSMQQREG